MSSTYSDTSCRDIAHASQSAINTLCIQPDCIVHAGMSAPILSSSFSIWKLLHVHPGITIGLGYFGVGLSSILYGITCCQTFIYYRSRKAESDHWFLKFLVLALWILDSTHEALILYTYYYYLVLQFANPLAIFVDTWAVPTSILINVFIGITVHIFLVRRIWKFSKNIWITGFCGLWVVAALGIDLVLPLKEYFIPSVVLEEIELQSSGVAALSVAFTGDAFIAIVITYYLYQRRTGTERHVFSLVATTKLMLDPSFRADNVISRLIALTISTGTLTTCFELASLISFAMSPHSLFDLFFNMLLGKLYTNSFLTILNTREFARSPMVAKTDQYSAIVQRGVQAIKSNKSYHSRQSALTVIHIISTNSNLDDLPINSHTYDVCDIRTSLDTNAANQDGRF
ncbi:hypothetical protein NM688_g2179 [Phlebia brevispora]|uniref:Uncharacterized protein n=1 Tax=Phlebia brevispora TaxID=194682 RepID=A0ACC1T9H5_9APHY|nr:hypothetical protein NM688_g2179 [Phlebia brevispora]